MAIPGSGAISMSMFNTELGRASNQANSSLAGGSTPAVGSLFWLANQSGSLNQTAPHAMSEWYGYSPGDTIDGSFTVTNSSFSYDSLTVSLGGFGTGGTVTVGNTGTFYPSGQVASPNSWIFTIIDANGGLGTVSVNSDTLSCTNATVSVTGNNTTTITITVTPTNYNGSTDTISGDITITNLP